MRFAIPACWALGVVLGTGAAGASGAAELTLPALVRQADRIFVGTVTAIRSEREPESGLVFTEVRFGELEVLKERGAGSARRATHALRVAGGQDRDGTFVQVASVPRFHAGERYLIFEKEGAGGFCPLVGWEQGCYRLAAAPIGGRAGRVVLDARDRPVVALRGGRIERPRPERSQERVSLYGAAVPGAGSRPAPPHDAAPHAHPEITRAVGRAARRLSGAPPPAATGTAMPASAFLAEVRRLLRG